MRNLFSKSRLLSFLTRAVHDKRGVTAVAFAITFAVLAPMSLGIFDVYTMTEQHGKLQDALDAATLYAARSNAFTTADVNTVGQKALTANLQLINGANLQSSSFALVTTTAGDTKVVGNAAVTLPAFAPMAFAHDPVAVTSEVTRPGNNLEVSLVLDTTGSMSGSPMTSLQSAANQLIDLIVSDTQTPYYSKMAIVPYSNAVNAGTYVNTVRGAATNGTLTDAVGDTKIKFTASSGSSKPTFNVSNCVSERIGTHAFDDTAYSAFGGKVGWVYPPTDGNNNCITATVQPLTSDKTTLHNEISSLTAAGSTAGHIGVAWGWYMISPNWSALFPTASQPAAYGSQHLIKAVVLMTDGAFNTAYCKGVISAPSSATDGSAGTATDMAACAAPNGNSFTQAQALCTAMKAAPNNITIYTVAFLHGGTDAQAEAILANCATDAAHAYVPTTGSSLQAAFQAIAADLNKLRLSH
jgi:Flp pilus assembly protein TadG